jgi:hypothetical protein
MNATLEGVTRTREDILCDRIRVFGLRALGRHTDIRFSVTREGTSALATFTVRHGKTVFTDMELDTITKVKEAIKQKFSLGSVLTLERVNATTATMRIPLC